MSPPNKKLKHTSYSNRYNKRQKSNYLDTNKKGFIATCNFREKECVRECYNLLNEYANKLFGVNEGSDSPIGGDDKNDIADLLKGEIQKELKVNTAKELRFQRVETDVANFIFIHTTLEDPVKLGSYIVSDIAENRLQKTRFLLRLIPIEVVTSACMSDIVAAAQKLIDKHFSCTTPSSFCVIFNKRYNNDIKRDDCIKEIADLVIANNPLHKVDLRDADKFIIAEVAKGFCCLSIIEDYYKFKRYNVHELANIKEVGDSTEKHNSNLQTAENDTENHTSVSVEPKTIPMEKENNQVEEKHTAIKIEPKIENNSEEDHTAAEEKHTTVKVELKIEDKSGDENCTSVKDEKTALVKPQNIDNIDENKNGRNTEKE